MENIQIKLPSKLVYLCNGNKDEDIDTVYDRLSYLNISHGLQQSMSIIENLQDIGRGEILELIAESPKRGDDVNSEDNLIITNSVFTATEYNSKKQLVNILAGIGSNDIRNKNYLNLNYYLSDSLEYIINDSKKLGSQYSAHHILNVLFALKTNNIMELDNSTNTIYRLVDIEPSDSVLFKIVRQKVEFI